MPVHIGEISSEVIASDGNLPLSNAQVELLIKLVLRRLEEQQRQTASLQEATRLRPQVAPGSQSR
jgi:hypothetical protein